MKRHILKRCLHWAHPMLLPERVERLRIYIPREYIDDVLYQIGLLKCAQINDISEEARGGVKRETLPDAYYRASRLISSIESLIGPDLTIDRYPSLSEVRSVIDRLDSAEHFVKSVESDRSMLERENVLERLRRLYASLRIYFSIAEARTKTVHTKLVQVIDLWVLSKKRDTLINKIKDITRDAYAIKVLEKKRVAAEHAHPAEESAPTYITVKQDYLRNLQSLVEARGVPSSREINPTIFMTVTVPIIFGLMFGDVGHSAILLVGGLLLWWVRKRGVRASGIKGIILNGAPLLTALGIGGLIFGFIYGELFGYESWFEAVFGYRPPPLRIELGAAGVWIISPLTEEAPLSNAFHTILQIGPFRILTGVLEGEGPRINPLMAFFKLAIVVGVFQILLGILMSIVNNLLRRDIFEALSGPVLWFWAYCGFAYLLLTYKETAIQLIMHPDLSSAAGLITVFGFYTPFILIFTIKTALHRVVGFGESMEMFLSSISHTLSYLRILALKLVHTAISQLAPEYIIVVTNMKATALNIILFLVITLLILSLESLLAFLHTLRLHWVEWFMKFYAGGGRKFQPFSILS